MTANFAIVNMRDGIRRDLQSFLVNNDSFPVLENAYLFRGRVQRRSCFTAVGNDGRLKGSFTGVANGGGHFIQALLDGTVGTGIPDGVSTFIVTGTVGGMAATATLTDPGGASPITLLTTNASITGVLTRSGVGAQIDVAGLDAGTAITLVYIPGLPVMGLRVKEQAAINDELLQAFDTRYTYIFDIASNDFILQNTFQGTTNTFVWTGTDSDFFWSCNYQRAFWVTNNIPGYHPAVNASPIAERDGIRWFGTTLAGTGWSNFNPPITSTNFLNGALMVLPYKDRLVAFNTSEGPDLANSVRFPQRLRCSQNGTVFYNNFPVDGGASSDAWRSDLVGKGFFIDAPTAEVIVSAEFIKDTLIVYFERSTWQAVYTNNETVPFVWQKINTELGADSTFSTVPFDRGVFTVGNYGIITTDSVNVERLDQKIPDEVFQIQNKNNGVKRVHGIRDYTSQLVYWTMPFNSEEDNNDPSYELTFPNQVLVFNYLDQSWAEFDDCFTCFGYWQRFSDITWAQLQKSWESTNVSWNSGVLQARFPDVIAGNQRGFVVVYSQIQNIGQNSPSLSISNIVAATRLITIPNHNLVNNQYVMITGEVGIASGNASGTPNNIIYKVTSATLNTFILDQIDATDNWSGIYEGSGLLTVIPNFRIQTKEFNPFYEKGDSLRLNYIDIYLSRTTQGQFEAQFYTSDNTSTPNESSVVISAPEPMPTYSTPSPTANFQANQSKIWHRIYTNSFGSFVQNIFTMNDTQIRDLNIASKNFVMHGLIYYINPSGRISYDI